MVQTEIREKFSSYRSSPKMRLTLVPKCVYQILMRSESGLYYDPPFDIREEPYRLYDNTEKLKVMTHY
jgi:hypothetical protein